MARTAHVVANSDAARAASTTVTLASSPPCAPCWNSVMTPPKARPAPTAIATIRGSSDTDGPLVRDTSTAPASASAIPTTVSASRLSPPASATATGTRAPQALSGATRLIAPAASPA